MEKRTPPGYVYSCAISPKISTKIVSLKFSPIHFGKLRYSNFNFFLVTVTTELINYVLFTMQNSEILH